MDVPLAEHRLAHASGRSHVARVPTTIVSSSRCDTGLIELVDPMDPDVIPMYPKLEA